MDITVKLDNARIGDMILFEQMQDGTHRMSDLLAFLGRIVVSDTPIEDFPLTSLREIMDAIKNEMDAMVAGDAEKN